MQLSDRSSLALAMKTFDKSIGLGLKAFVYGLWGLRFILSENPISIEQVINVLQNSY